MVANATKPPAPVQPAAPAPADPAGTGPKPPASHDSAKGAGADRVVRPSPAPGTQARFSMNSKRGGPPGRPMLHPGMGVASRIGNQQASPEQEAKLAEAKAAATFNDKPLEDVIAYLTKNRSMTFVFDGSFDLKQKVTVDVFDKEQWEIADLLAEKLGAVLSREEENTWRVSPKPPPATLEQPDVDEEPTQEDSPDPSTPPPQGGGR